ncbi:MAG: winged helix-turn-helix domain-containing protein [Nitrososphaerales archaeon]
MPAWKEKDRNPKRLEQRRKDAIRLLLGGKLSKSEVASTLGVSVTAVKNWWKAYVDRGRKMDALEANKHTGRPPLMSRNQSGRLARLLSKGAEHYGFDTDIWTSERVAWLIKEKFGIGYHPAHVSRILHSMNLSWQKAEGVARERDEAKVRDWVQNVLPDIKKVG